MNRLLLILGLSFALVTAGQAKNIYIAQSTAGADTGADAANAHSAAWFNTSANWGAGGTQVSPGDTVHLTGNITTALTVQASGTAGNITTVLFDPGATMSVAAWAITGAIIVNGKSYITIDGGATGTIGGPNGNAALANGIIENTNNGVGLGSTIGSVGIWLASPTFCTVKNLVIRNLFVRTSGTDQNGGGKGVHIYWNGGAQNYHDVIVTNCIFHDIQTGAFFDTAAGCYNFEMSYCTAYNCNWGGGAGTHASSTDLTGLLVHDNYFYAWSNWDDTAVSNTFHHNGFFAFSSFSQTAATLTTVRFYNNQVGSGTSGEWGLHASGALFIQDKVYDVWWYNNLLISDATTYPNDGLVFCDPAGAITSTYRIYNNTIIGKSNTIGTGIYIAGWQNTGGVQSVYVENNIISGTRYAITVYYNATFTLVADHNLSFGLDATTPYSTSTTGSAAFKSVAQWQALGFDADLLTGNPTLSGTYTLNSGSPAIGAGANLSSYFTTDKAGAARAPSGAWDVGAYVYAPFMLPYPKGVWAAYGAGTDPDPGLVANTGIVGTGVSEDWDVIEAVAPIAGVHQYVWTSLDYKISKAKAAGLKINLNITNSSDNTPLWLSNQEVAANPSEVIYLLDPASGHSTFCQNIKTVVYWNTAFHAARRALIAALGARYNSDPEIVAVTCQFANHNSNDWNIQDTVGTIACGTRGVGGNQVVDQPAQWLTATWTEAKMLQVGKDILDDYATAFPDKYLKLPIGGLEDRLASPDGGVTAGNYTTMARDMDTYVYGRPYASRMYLQRNIVDANWGYGCKWETGTIISPCIALGTVPGTGAQNYIKYMIWGHSKAAIYGGATPRQGGLQMVQAATGGPDGCRQGGQAGGPCDDPGTVGIVECPDLCVMQESLNVASSYNVSFIEVFPQDGKNILLNSMYTATTIAMGGTPRTADRSGGAFDL